MRAYHMEELNGLKCAICGKSLDEGYCFEPDTEEEYDTLELKFGDVANWLIGECCFEGYCGAVSGLTPTLFFTEIIMKIGQEMKESLSGPE